MNALWLAVVLPLAYGVYRYVTCLLHNIAQAKKSGLPYVVVRMYFANYPHRRCVPIH